MNRFQRWLLSELNTKRETPNSASLGAGLDHAAISRYLDKTTPAPDSCRKLAAYFNVPASYVLFLAGHIEAPPDRDWWLAQMEILGQSLPDDQKQLLIDMARTFHERQQ